MNLVRVHDGFTNSSVLHGRGLLDFSDKLFEKGNHAVERTICRTYIHPESLSTHLFALLTYIAEWLDQRWPWVQIS